MDTQEQVQFAKNLAVEVLARHGNVGTDVAREEFFKAAGSGTGGTGNKVGAGDLAAIFDEAVKAAGDDPKARDLDQRVGQPQPEGVNTAASDYTKIHEQVGKRIPQAGFPEVPKEVSDGS